jgi:hypothetical protein
LALFLEGVKHVSDSGVETVAKLYYRFYYRIRKLKKNLFGTTNN